MQSKFCRILNKEFESRTQKNSRFSLRSFARLLELAPSTVHQYLTGKYYPTARNLEAISSRLGWSEEILRLLNEDLNRINRVDDQDNVVKVDHLEDVVCDIVVRLKYLTDAEQAKSDNKWLLNKLQMSGADLPVLESAMEFLKEKGVIEVSNDILRTVRRVKLVTHKKPRGAVLEFQKESLRRFEKSLTEIEKEKRLVLMSNLQIDPAFLPEIAQAMNEFLDRLQKRFGRKKTGESYQLVCGLIPTRNSDN